MRRAVSSSTSRGEDCLLQLAGQMLVVGLRFGKLDQQFAHGSVARVLRRLAVIALGLVFHVLGKLAHFLQAERAGQPQGLLGVQEALDVLAADQRQVFAKFFAVEVIEHGAVMHLLLGHLVEHLGGGGKLLAQAFGEAAVDAAVLLLVGNGERQHFLFGQVGKVFHVESFRSLAGRPVFILEAPKPEGPLRHRSSQSLITHCSCS
jgi:hypothetical protein